MTTEDNKALVRRFDEEVYVKRNLAAVDDLIAPTHVDHTLPPGLPEGREGTKRAIDMYLTAFPDLQLAVEDQIAEGDKVVTRMTTSGTQRRAFGPFPPTGRRVKVETVDIARIADGKIVESWGLDDRLGLLQQLGIVPAMFGSAFFAGLVTGAGLTLLLRRLLQ